MAKAGNCCTFCTFCTRSAPVKRGSGIRQGEKTPPLTLPLEGRGVIIVEEKTPPLPLPLEGRGVIIVEKTPPLTLPCARPLGDACYRRDARMGGSNYCVVAFRVGAEASLVGIEAL